MLRHLATALVLLLGAVGCGGPSGADPNAAPTGAFEALPPCDPLPELDASLPDVPGLTLPEGAVITSVTPQDPLVHVTAEVAMTPVNVRRDYESRSDVEVITSEDEVFEAELLVARAGHRTAVKATALCRDHSVIIAVVAKEAPGTVSS